MKRFFLGLAVVAVALCLAVPAMADVKMTTTGYMNVRGIYLDGNILDRGATDGLKNDSSNAWYLMEMVIDPTLHINDKVRIHARVTVMERAWRGGHGAENDTNGFGITANRGGNYRAEHNFWWEQLYMSFPVFGGTLSVGRMSGGSWGYAFQDSESNRDRIKYVRKFGHITVLGIIEKLGEGDGGLPLTMAPAAGDSFTNSWSDTEAYAVGAVVPFSKDIVWRPLVYYIQQQQASAFGSGYILYVSNALGLKMGPFFLDGELGYWNTTRDNFFNPGDFEGDQWAGWLDLGMNFGPGQVALGGFYLQGESDKPAVAPANNNGDKRQSISTTGEEFQPMFLFFSEDVGLLWNTSGVANGTIGLSGYQCFYLRGAYKISDTMKVKGIAGYLLADKMEINNVDDELGWEFDLAFEWKLMDNLTYVIDAGYLMAGKYFEDIGKVGGGTHDLSNDVFGMRHMLVINW
jgi:hypothetical protein